MATTVGEIAIDIRAKFDKLSQDMDSAKGKVKGAADEIQNISTVMQGYLAKIAASEFVSFVNSAIHASAELKQLSEITNVSVEALSGLKSVAKLSGTSMDEVAGAMNKLSKSLVTANEDSDGTAQAIKALGLNFNDFKRMSPDEQMLAVAKSMDKFQDGAGKSAAMMMLFGKSGAQMLPLMHDLAEAGELHAKVTAEEAEAADQYEKNMARLQVSGDAWKKELAQGMIPALNDGVKAFTAVFNSTGGLRDQIADLKKNGKIDEWTRNAITGLTYLMDAFSGLKAVILTVGEGIGFLAASIVSQFDGIAQIVTKVIHGDFSGAADTYKAKMAEQKAMTEDFKASLDKTWGEPTLGSMLRARMADMKEMGTTTEAQKPKLDLTALEAANTKAYDSFLKTIKEKIAAQELEATATGTATNAEKEYAKWLSDVTNGYVQLTPAQKENAEALWDQYIKADKATQAKKEQLKTMEDWSKAQEKETEELNKKLAAAELELAQMGLTKAEKDSVAASTYAVEAANKREAASALELAAANAGPLRDAYLQAADSMREQADKLDKLSGVMKDQAFKQAAIDTAEEWKKTAKEIETSLTDALTNALSNGKSLVDSLWDYIKAAFKNQVVRLMVAPMMGAISGMANAAGIDGSAGGLGQGGVGIMSALSSGRSIYDIAAGGTAGMSGTIGSGAARFGNWLYGQGFTGAGEAIGTNSAMIGTAGTYLGYGAAGIGIGSAIQGDKQFLGMNGTTTSAVGAFAGGAYMGMTYGSSMGPWGALIGGIVGGILGGAFGMGGKESQGEGIQGKFGGGGFAGQAYQNWKQGGGWFMGDKYGTDYATLPEKVQGYMNDASAAVLTAVTNLADGLNLPVDKLGTIFTDMKVQITGKAEEDQKAINDAIKAYQDALISTYADAVKPFQKAGEDIYQTLERLATIQVVSAQLNQLGGIFSNIATSSVQARDSMITLAGGIEALMSKAQSFVQNFYSQGEQAGMVAAGIADQLRAVGIDPSGLKTRDDYRALVESMDVSTQVGREQLNALLTLAPQFAGISQYMADNKLTLDALALLAPEIQALSPLFEAQTAATDTTTNAVDNTTAAVNATTTAVTDGSNAIVAAVNGMASTVAGAVAAAIATAGAGNAAIAAKLAEIESNAALANAAPGG